MKNAESIISEIIKERGLRQKFVSQKTNISETNLSLILRGKRSLKANEFISLCAFLGLNFNDFAGCTNV